MRTLEFYLDRVNIVQDNLQSCLDNQNLIGVASAACIVGIEIFLFLIDWRYGKTE